jgi:mannose-6-phosphate isomerase-like protein (cupin superfamily)
MLAEMTRVRDTETTPPDNGEGFLRWLLVPPERGSSLALDTLHLAPGAAYDLTDPLHDTQLLIHAGGGSIELQGTSGEEVRPLSAAFVTSGTGAQLLAGSEGLEAVRTTLGASVDLHAPMGGVATVVSLDTVEQGKATGSRAFQILHGPHNGSTRGTAFVGYVPPGKAPWHYHLYDEVLWILRGTGRVHIGDTVEELGAGSAFRLHAREVHIVENTDPTAELAILGIFSPAGSPSAAYLEPGIAASYSIG